VGGRAALAIALLVLAAAKTRATELDVTVANIRTSAGHVLVAVCTQPQFLSMHCSYSGRASARRGAVEVRIGGIPPGIYAVEAFQDANDNGKIDRNFFGLPTEGIGFSRDAPFRFGPPRFSDAAIALGARGGRIVLHLRYLG
jgi:uncharacterized protein (DUF2141 family)